MTFKLYACVYLFAKQNDGAILCTDLLDFAPPFSEFVLNELDDPLCLCRYGLRATTVLSAIEATARIFWLAH